MTNIDIAFGLLAGILSVMSPDSLMLLPLLFCAIGARDRPLIIAPALGLSLVLTGVIAVSLSTRFGFDASRVRMGACIVLILQGLLLNSPSLSERYALFTGGAGGGFSDEAPPPGVGVRHVLLTLFVGANWFPPIGPTLAKTSLMAADGRTLPLALGTFFTFGLGAAIPWIILGRFIRALPGMANSGLVRGMAGKRVFGLLLIAVAVMGLTGGDLALSHRLDTLLPPWAAKIAGMF